MRWDFHKESHAMRSLAKVSTANFQIHRIIGGEGITQISQKHSKFKKKKVKLGKVGYKNLLSIFTNEKLKTFL